MHPEYHTGKWLKQSGVPAGRQKFYCLINSRQQRFKVCFAILWLIDRSMKK
jgi:hypothetical protein